MHIYYDRVECPLFAGERGNDVGRGSGKLWDSLAQERWPAPGNMQVFALKPLIGEQWQG